MQSPALFIGFIFVASIVLIWMGLHFGSRWFGKRQAGANKGLRNDRNPSSTAGRRNNRVANEGG